MSELKVAAYCRVSTNHEEQVSKRMCTRLRKYQFKVFAVLEESQAHQA